ncbi:CCR5 protein, partial [Nothocercus julius]|nr:CCR5 protein [Nothocercus julius]
FPVLYSILFVTGLMGNALVVWVLIVFKKINAMTDVYLLNLAFSDLLFVLSLPFLAHYSAAGHWTFGNAMCKIISSAYFIGFYSSAFFITIMSIDRYLAIVRSKCHTRNKYKAMKLVFIVVTVFFLFWTPINIMLFLDSLQNMYIIDDCHTSKRLALAIELAEAFSFAHCCLNPVIYAFVGEKFKKYLWEAFGKHARFLLMCKDYRTFSGHSSDKHSSALPVSSQSSVIDTIL